MTHHFIALDASDRCVRIWQIARNSQKTDLIDTNLCADLLSMAVATLSHVSSDLVGVVVPAVPQPNVLTTRCVEKVSGKSCVGKVGKVQL